MEHHCLHPMPHEIFTSLFALHQEMLIGKLYKCAQVGIISIYFELRQGWCALDFKAGGRNIQRIRKQRKLTQEQLAELVGCTANTISRIECGSLFPALDTVIILCNALNTNADSILAQYIQADSIVRWNHLADKLGTLPTAKQDKIEAILDCLIKIIWYKKAPAQPDWVGAFLRLCKMIFRTSVIDKSKSYIRI